MKKYIERIISELTAIYPNRRITIRNGFIGIDNGDRLLHTSYLGNAYYEIDGIVYTDYNKGVKKVLALPKSH